MITACSEERFLVVRLYSGVDSFSCEGGWIKTDRPIVSKRDNRCWNQGSGLGVIMWHVARNVSILTKRSQLWRRSVCNPSRFNIGVFTRKNADLLVMKKKKQPHLRLVLPAYCSTPNTAQSPSSGSRTSWNTVAPRTMTPVYSVHPKWHASPKIHPHLQKASWRPGLLVMGTLLRFSPERRQITETPTCSGTVWQLSTCRMLLRERQVVP